LEGTHEAFGGNLLDGGDGWGLQIVEQTWL
jgi:hypothetical protein